MAANDVVAARVEAQHPHKKILASMSSPGALAKWPIVGLLMFILGSLLFGGLALNLVDKGPLLQWDTGIANTLPAIALKTPAFMRGLMDAGYYIGDQVILAIAVLVGLFLIVKRLWKELAMVVFGLVGASSLFLFLSHLFARPRPPTQIWIVLSIPGFPSGHAITVVVFYGLMAYLLVPKMRSAFWKVVVVAGALLIMGFVGFSRVFTGGHYLTDVLSGYAVGIAWSGLVFTLIELFVQKRRNRHVEKR